MEGRIWGERVGGGCGGPAGSLCIHSPPLGIRLGTNLLLRQLGPGRRPRPNPQSHSEAHAHQHMHTAGGMFQKSSLLASLTRLLRFDIRHVKVAPLHSSSDETRQMVIDYGFILATSLRPGQYPGIDIHCGSCCTSILSLLSQHPVGPRLKLTTYTGSLL